MNWFLYDRDLRHERVIEETSFHFSSYRLTKKSDYSSLADGQRGPRNGVSISRIRMRNFMVLSECVISQFSSAIVDISRLLFAPVTYF